MNAFCLALCLLCLSLSFVCLDSMASLLLFMILALDSVHCANVLTLWLIVEQYWSTHTHCPVATDNGQLNSCTVVTIGGYSIMTTPFYLCIITSWLAFNDPSTCNAFCLSSSLGSVLFCTAVHMIYFLLFPSQSQWHLFCFHCMSRHNRHHHKLIFGLILSFVHYFFHNILLWEFKNDFALLYTV